MIHGSFGLNLRALLFLRILDDEKFVFFYLKSFLLLWKVLEELSRSVQRILNDIYLSILFIYDITNSAEYLLSANCFSLPYRE